MNRYINCIAHNSSDGQLLMGSQYTAIFDCGMMFCAGETISNVKKALKGRTLDFLFLTHTHYDHVGALPLFRKEWSNLKVITSETGKGILLKDTPRRVIRELSLTAAKIYNVDLKFDYSDDLFHADITVADNEIISLGGLSVQTLFTPGHTRDSLSFYVPEIKLLILNETPGILMPDGSAYPCYLTSYNDMVKSIEKCSQLPFEHLSISHRGVIDSKIAGSFLEKALAAGRTCRDFILDMKNKNYSEEEMLNGYFNKYATETLLKYQPKEAFLANARATISGTLKDFFGHSGTCLP